MNKTTLIMAFFLFALVCSCQDQSGDDSTLDAGSDSDVDGDTSIDWEAMCRQGEPIEGGIPGARMAGTWGMLLNLGTKQTDIPNLGAMASDTRTWALVELISDESGTYTASEKVCAIQHLTEAGTLGQLITPNAFVATVQVLTRTVTVDEEAPCADWISDDVWEVRGVNLNDEKQDPLPQNGSIAATDARSCDSSAPGIACDQDEDGFAGMTNTLTGLLTCDVYVTQRWHAQLGGYIMDQDTIAGPVIAAHSEQSLLGASDPSCNVGNPGTVPILEDCPNHFYFFMKRLSEGATCADVMALTSCDETQFSCAGKTDYPLNPTAAIFADLPGYTKDECHLNKN